MSRDIQVANNWKCNNLYQYESIWEERIKHLTHIFLSSQVNTAWIGLRNTTINWQIWHRINSNKFIKIIMLNNYFHSHWHFFNLTFKITSLCSGSPNILDIASSLTLGPRIVKTTTTGFHRKIVNKFSMVKRISLIW